jgi:hypothetical protein
MDCQNARVEQINTQIRLIIRRGFGYHSPSAVIALAMLSLGGLCPLYQDGDTTHGYVSRFKNTVTGAQHRALAFERG